MLWADADQIVQEILAHLDGCPAIVRREVAGSYRRGKETVGDLDILVVARQTAGGDGPSGRVSRGGRRAGPRRDEDVGPAGQRFTGRSARGAGGVVRGGAAILHRLPGPQHRVAGHGQGPRPEDQRVWRLSRRASGLPAHTEEEVYAALDLPWIPPELREARQEFEWAAAGKLPELVELDEIRGDLHIHSTWTDGMATIEEMAAGGQGARAEVHGHYRPLEAGEHGRRPGRGEASPAMGRDRQDQRAAAGNLRCSRESRSTSSSAAGWTCRTTFWRRPIGWWQVSTMARISPASRSPAGSSGPWRILTCRPSPTPRAG